jgi:hypothetical protein
MNRFVDALITVFVVVIGLVIADQVTGALERARQRRVAAKSTTDTAADPGMKVTP